MVFVILGALLVGLKMAGLPPVDGWSWLIVLLPFVLAMGWWWYGDISGRTARVQTDKMLEEREQRRRNRNPGLSFMKRFDHAARERQRKADERERASRQRLIDKIEGDREKRRQANRKSILTTHMSSESEWAPSQAEGKPAAKRGG